MDGRPERGRQGRYSARGLGGGCGDARWTDGRTPAWRLGRDVGRRERDRHGVVKQDPPHGVVARISDVQDSGHRHQTKKKQTQKAQEQHGLIIEAGRLFLLFHLLVLG